MSSLVALQVKFLVPADFSVSQPVSFFGQNAPNASQFGALNQNRICSMLVEKGSERADLEQVRVFRLFCQQS